ncbi:MAG: carbohydrate binding family 9 domain-containing protein [Gemmatimonadetes bacterium]|nr:carbohydrate binding family 9 domain-containing protein [Gemmatimonadota bacterium]
MHRILARALRPDGKTVSVGLLLALSSSLVAQPRMSDVGEEGADPGGEGKLMQAVRVQRAPAPTLDGVLDDTAWGQAVWVSDFVQKEPEQGAAPTAPTEIAFVYDDVALYIGARMTAPAPGRIADQMTRRDDMSTGTDRLIVSLDTYHDGRTAYSFAVTAAGVRIDWFHPTDREGDHDHTYDPVWEAKTAVGEQAWTAELRIPFSQLRFSGASDQVWGVNVHRTIPAIDEEQYWVLVPRDQTGWASRFGDLVGVRAIEPSRRIEILPYVASEATLTSDALVDEDDPFEDGSDATLRAGVDFKMGLGPNLTLDATINPDFGQVEADPAEVNLSAFETFFPERRPFFTEGQQMLQGNGPPFYYSRRIGAPPHRFPGGDFRDTPNTSTILGAAKVTGQLESGWSVGAIAALTDDETARTFDLETGTFEEVDVEPVTGYGAVRLQKQFGADASTIGVTLTGVERGVENGDALAALLPDRAFTGGVDWNRRFDGGAYELRGHAGFSHVAGDSGAIARIQRSSAHYYQRPDAGHVDFDPLRTSLSGWSAALGGGKRSGTWRWDGGLWGDSPGFEINDLGRLGRGDDIANWGNVSYNVTEPGALLRRWNLGLFTNSRWNFDGVLRNRNIGIFSNWTAKNFWNGWFEHGRDVEALNDAATRGGPLMERPSRWWAAFGVFSNSNRTTRFGIRSVVSADELGGWSWRVDPEFRVQPIDRLTLSTQPRYIRRRGSRQYLATLDGGTETTFGSRYVFGWIDYSEVAAPLRADWLFGPDLSLELYAEPFAASGHYFDIGELAAARSGDLRTYGEAAGTAIVRDESGGYTVTDGDATFALRNPDFDVLSFRSNLVLRWEWRPGSTMFLVWQQNRSAFGERGERVSGGDLLEALESDGENVIAAKFTYYLPF